MYQEEVGMFAIIVYLLYAMILLTNTQEEALKVKLNLGRHTKLWQLTAGSWGLAAEGWWLTAGDWQLEASG